MGLRRSTGWEHSPIIMAMLTGNTMRNCADAEKLLSECQKSQSDDMESMICQAAARQVDLCMRLDIKIGQSTAQQMEQYFSTNPKAK